MIKNKKDINNNLDSELFEDISIEEIDKEMNDFHIDKEKIDSIKYSFDKDSLIKSAIDKAEKDIKKDKFKNNFIKAASILIVILSIGVYNPVLAHYSPILMNGLSKINAFLKVDKISAYLKIDTIIPKAVLNEDNKVEFITMGNYKVSQSSSSNSNDVVKITSEYDVVSFIHQMSNGIINASDGKKFGLVEITPDNIDLALDSIKYINNEDAKKYLSSQLNRWKKGDFSNAVQVHNYVWHMLNGNIGIASSLDEGKINEIVNKYFK